MLIDDPRVQKLARLLVQRHGEAAPKLAHLRAVACLHQHDHEAAAVWALAAKITKTSLGQSADAEGDCAPSLYAIDPN
jgi:hypothetical protein